MLVIVPLVSAIMGGVISAHIAAVNQSRITEKRFQHELKLAALDKRLEVHQQAYTWWLNVLRSLFEKEKLHKEILPSAYKWWDENCLYLHKNVAHKLRAAFLIAGTYEVMADAYRGQPNGADSIERMHLDIASVGPLIQAAVGLPEINPSELASNSRDQKVG